MRSAQPPFHRTAQAAVVDHIRRRILEGTMRPGERLRQHEIAERLGVSTTPVREAFRQLTAENLLDTDAHRGVVVHTPSDAELTEIYELRQVIEPIAIASTVDNITEEQLELAEEYVRAMDVERDPGAWSVLNREYHDLLSESAGKPKTAEILKALRNTGSLYIAYGLRRDPAVRARANEEHRALLEACRGRDTELAAELVRKHLIVGATLGRTGLADTRQPSGDPPK